jgi:hypothetical protein
MKEGMEQAGKEVWRVHGAVEGRYKQLVNSDASNTTWASHTGEVGAVRKVHQPIVESGSLEGLAIDDEIAACEMLVPITQDPALAPSWPPGM